MKTTDQIAAEATEARIRIVNFLLNNFKCPLARWQEDELDTIIQAAIEKAIQEPLADRDEARAQRDWLIKECERIGVTVNVQIGAPNTEVYRLSRAAHAADETELQKAVNVTALLPCPFCGSENVGVEPLVGGFVVDCKDCCAGCGTCHSEQAARDQWNKRKSLREILKERGIERRMWVGLTAAGFNGRFELPEKHFNDLLTWLAERSCGQEKQPNDYKLANDK